MENDKLEEVFFSEMIFLFSSQFDSAWENVGN